MLQYVRLHGTQNVGTFLQVGEEDPDIFFTDRPREGRPAQRNREYISFWADEAPAILLGRSPLECYRDFMRSFRDAFLDDLGDAIEEVVIGCGPCGELRCPNSLVQMSEHFALFCREFCVGLPWPSAHCITIYEHIN